MAGISNIIWIFFRADARVIDGNLDSLFAQNAPSLYEHETAMGFTDQLASFVKNGYVAGPFKSPPFEKFRINQIFGVKQDTKIRPVMNLSHPKGQSFNSSIPKGAFPKVTMSSSKKVAQDIKLKGPQAKVSKMDMQNAYKIIPCPPQQYWLQGNSLIHDLFKNFR